MYDVNESAYTPENFFAGNFPIAKSIGIVDTGKTIKKFEPVKQVGDKIQPVEFVAASGAQDYSAGTAAVHTLVIAKAPTAGDTITINGEVYTAVESDPVAANKEFVAGTTAAAATSLKLALESGEGINFTIGGSSANITLTQKVAGIGELPTLVTSVEGGATISTTTEYAAGTDPKPTKTATENTAEGLYGIAAEAAGAGEKIVIYLTGEFFSNAIQWRDNVTEAMLKTQFRKLGIFLKEMNNNG